MSCSDIVALMIICVCQEEENKINKKRKKRIWAKKCYQKRLKFPQGNVLENFGSTDSIAYLKNILRMDTSIYQELLSMVEPLIKKQDTIMRTAISAHQRLLATLRFLALGEVFENLKLSTGISPISLSIIIMETCAAIIKILKNYIQIPENEKEWKAIAKDFESQWNFPNCIGAIEGKHVELKKPISSGNYYLNYKKTYSIAVMAIVNANHEFIFVDVGKNGNESDSGMFKKMNFKQKYDKNELRIPQPEYLPFSDSKFPYVFLGDDAFPLEENLIKSYHHKNLKQEDIIFNCRLSRARRVADHAFGILASRFRIIVTKINLEPKKASLIILTCFYLHNFLIRKNTNRYFENSTDVEDIETSAINSATLRSSAQLIKFQALKSENPTNKATDVRNKFKEYFNTVGSIPSQNLHVE